MKYLAIDSETELISPGNQAPHLICVSWFDGKDSGLLHWTECENWLEEKIKGASSDQPLVFHHAPFDLAVFANQFPKLLPLIFKALDNGAIADTKIRERLSKIAQGTLKNFKYSLKDLAERYLNLELDKDTWRLRYGELKNLQIDLWPEGAKEYALSDAKSTGQIFEFQENEKIFDDLFIDEPNQVRAAFALYLTSAWGLITSKEAVERLKIDTQNELSTLKQFLVDNGAVRVDNTRNMKFVESLMESVYPDAPRTPTGKVKCDEETCQDSGNEILIGLSRYRQLQTLMTKDIETLEKGISAPIHTRFESLLETGRTSSSGPNIQNPRCEAGIRECYIPRPGFVYAACDYNSAELHTLAQVCYSVFGHSQMREKLLAGRDLHLDFAAQTLHIDYEEVIKNKIREDVKEARQRAKAANFGFPGGMGAQRFVDYAKKTGLIISELEVKALKKTWLQNFPEMEQYFSWVNNLLRSDNTIKHLFSQRYRGGVKYTEACNSYFQGLASDGGKSALYSVVKKCYTDSNSDLFGSRPVNFIHDELILEVPEQTAHLAAEELRKTMVEVFNEWVPDVPISAEVCLMRCWAKKAEPTFDQNKRLIPWEKSA